MTDSLVRKIAALLNKAERTDNEHERDTYLAKASELQEKYVIDSADLAAASAGPVPGVEIIRERFLTDKASALIKARRELLNGIAILHRCRAVLGYRRAYVEVIGFSDDVAFVTSMFNSLSIQLLSAIAVAERTPPLTGEGGSSKSWRVSFAHGWVSRVYARMAEAKESRRTPGTDLVLRNREDEVSAALGPTTKAAYKHSIKDRAGYLAGDAAGQHAALGVHAGVTPVRAADGS